MTILYKNREIPAQDGLRSGLNATVSTIGANLCVTGHDESIALPTAITDTCFGVTRQSIAAGLRGSIGKRGRFIATAGVGGVTAGVRLMHEIISSAGTGKLIPWAPSSGANATVVATSVTAASADGEFEAEFDGINNIAQGA